MMKYFAISIVFAALLVACNQQAPVESRFSVTPEPGAPAFTTAVTIPTDSTSSAYPAPGGEATPYPGPQQSPSTSSDGRSQTALKAYNLALDTAKKDHSSDSQLYAIVPSEIMIRNLGGLPVVPGWFFKFKTPDSPREYIVQVVDEVVSGTTMAEAVEQPEPKELPLDMTQVKIDSAQVLEQFKAYAAEQNIPTDGKIFDLELVNLEGAGGPTWSVVDSTTQNWLYTVSAANGNQVSNPHG